MIHSTHFWHYYAHHQELKTIQIITACGTQPTAMHQTNDQL